MLVLPFPRSRAAVLVCALAALAALAGCGNGDEAREQPVRGSQLTIYASAPLHGAEGVAGRDVVRAQRLALDQAGGEIGRYRVRLVALDATRPQSDGSDPRQISENARRAADDPRAIAYLGEVRTGASAISIPILNEAGLLSVSPLDTALGLTTHTAAITGSPERYYPNAEQAGRTFARLVPSDRVQAAVQLRAMADDGVRRLVLLTDEDAPGLALASAIQAAARAYGVAIVAEERVDPHAREHEDVVARVVMARADATLYAGGVREAALRVWRELAAVDPSLRMYAPAALVDAPFLARAGALAATTYVTRPVLALAAYPRAARRFARAFQKRWEARPAPEAAYGYESMRAVLTALEQAEREADGGPLLRSDVVRAFFAPQRRTGVLGTYRIDEHGDTSLRRWGLYRVVDGRLRFQRALDG